jgi:hypothetical protein
VRSPPLVPEYSVAGATVGCGSHGAAPNDGTLADAVVALTLVDAHGQFVALTETDEDSAAGSAKDGAVHRSGDGHTEIDSAAANGTATDGSTAHGTVAESSEADGTAADGSAAAHASSARAPRMCLRTARVSLGLLGVAVSLTLRAVPRYWVVRHVHTLAVLDFVARADALCEVYRHLWVKCAAISHGPNAPPWRNNRRVLTMPDSNA